MLNFLNSKFVLSKNIQDLAIYFGDNSQSPKLPSLDQKVLIQTVEDPYYLGLFGAICTELRQFGNLQFEQYVPRSFHVGESSNLFKFCLYRLTNQYIGHKWTKTYAQFVPKVGIRFIQFSFLQDCKDALSALRIFKYLKTSDDVNTLRIQNIYVGDLINDTYLRFKPSPQIHLKDYYLLFIIWHTVRIVRNAKNYMMHHRPSLFLVSYSTYLQHGVLTRVALDNEVPVYTFGNYQEFAKKLTKEDTYHTKNPTLYRALFEKLPNPTERLNLAEDYLKRKMAGEIDFQFAYMRQSAYAVSELDVPDVKGAFIIFLHDFYDSPHVYPEMIFNDFWEWTCFTMDTLMANNLKFFIKPHPNQIDLNDGVLQQLKERYPDLPLLSPKITNTQLIDGGMICAITVYGSVAHEMAYFGIPSIACARHPHIGYSFCQTATSKEDYKKRIENFLDNKDVKDPKNTKQEALEFYYMHNLSMTEEETELLKLTSHYRQTATKSLSDENIDLVRAIKDFSKNIEFKRFCTNLKNNLFDMNHTLQ